MRVHVRGVTYNTQSLIPVLVWFNALPPDAPRYQRFWFTVLRQMATSCWCGPAPLAGSSITPRLSLATNWAASASPSGMIAGGPCA